MRRSRAKVRKVTHKSLAERKSKEKLTLSWLMEDLLSEVACEIEAFSGQIGLRIIRAVSGTRHNGKYHVPGGVTYR